MKLLSALSRLKLRTKMLLAFAVIIVFTLSTIGTVNLAVSYKLNKSLIVANAVSVNRKACTVADNYIKTAENTLFLRTQTNSFLRAMTALKVTREPGFREKQRVNTELSTLLYSSESYRYVVAGDYHGEIYTMSKDPLLTLNSYDYSELAAHLWERKGACQWVKGFGDTLEIRRSLISSQTIESLGFIILGIDRSYFSDIFLDIQPDAMHNLALFNSEHQLILQNSDIDTNVLEQAFNSFLSSNTGQDALIQLNGDSYLAAGMKTPLYGWFVISVINTDLIARELEPLVYTICLVCIPLLALSILLSVLVSRTLMRNVKILKVNMDCIAAGDFSHEVVPTSHDELGALAEQFEFMRQRIVELNHMIVKEQETRRTQELLSLEARYHSLRDQHDPHFLYNVLDSLSSVALLRGQPDISQIARKLAELLRESLSEKRDIVSLRESINYCTNYTSLYELLYHDNIGFTYDIEPELLDMEVPSFTIQPLVENAIRHGIEKKSGGGQVLIRAFVRDDNLIISVIDNGAGFEQPMEGVFPAAQDDDMHLHIGLKNLLERIYLLYGPLYGIAITSQPNRGTRVDVTLPLRPYRGRE